MKLKAKISDSQMIPCFLKILVSMTKYSKLLIFRFNKDTVSILADSRNLVDGQLSIWAYFNTDSHFSEYKFKGVNEELHNSIVMEVASDKLSNLLHSIREASKQLVIKLKKSSSGPQLSFLVEYPSNDQRDRSVVTDVSVKIVERREWHYYVEPENPPFDVSFYLPEFKVFKNTVDRLATMDKFCVMSGASNDGGRRTFKISVETSETVVTSEFTRLERGGNRLSDTSSQEDNDHQSQAIEPVTVRIDIRKMNTFLGALLLKPTSGKCLMRADDRIAFSFFHDFVSFNVLIKHCDA